MTLPNEYRCFAAYPCAAITPLIAEKADRLFRADLRPSGGSLFADDEPTAPTLQVFARRKPSKHVLAYIRAFAAGCNAMHPHRRNGGAA